jgi:hypothetical protein
MQGTPLFLKLLQQALASTMNLELEILISVLYAGHAVNS